MNDYKDIQANNPLPTPIQCDLRDIGQAITTQIVEFTRTVSDDEEDPVSILS